MTKVLGEEMVRRYVDLYGLGAVILRYCWVFGAGDVLDLFTTQTWEEFMSPEQRVAPQRRWSGGLGADVAIEASGRTVGAELALRLVRRGGRVVWFGVYPERELLEISP